MIIDGQKYSDGDSVAEFGEILHEGAFSFTEPSEAGAIASNTFALYAQPQGVFKLRFLLEDLAGDDTSVQNAILEGLHYGNEQLMTLQDGDDQRLVEIINVSQAFGVQTNYFHNITLTLRERDVASLLGLRFNTVINKHVGYSVSLPDFAEDGTTAITGHLVEYKLPTETTWTRGAVQAGTGMQTDTIELPTEDLYDVRIVARSASADEQVGLQRCVMAVNYWIVRARNTGNTWTRVVAYARLDSAVPQVYRDAATDFFPVREWQNLALRASINTQIIVQQGTDVNSFPIAGFRRYDVSTSLTNVRTADAVRFKATVTGYVTYWSPWMDYADMLTYRHSG